MFTITLNLAIQVCFGPHETAQEKRGSKMESERKLRGSGSGGAPELRAKNFPIGTVMVGRNGMNYQAIQQRNGIMKWTPYPGKKVPSLLAPSAPLPSAPSSSSVISEASSFLPATTTSSFAIRQPTPSRTIHQWFPIHTTAAPPPWRLLPRKDEDIVMTCVLCKQGILIPPFCGCC